MGDVDGFADELERLVRRVAEVEPDRLARPLDTGLPLADEGHALAQHLADAAADIESRERRPVPRLADRAVPDQLAVTGRDLVTVLVDRHLRVPDDVTDHLRALRQSV